LISLLTEGRLLESDWTDAACYSNTFPTQITFWHISNHPTTEFGIK